MLFRIVSCNVNVDSLALIFFSTKTQTETTPSYGRLRQKQLQILCPSDTDNSKPSNSREEQLSIKSTKNGRTYKKLAIDD